MKVFVYCLLLLTVLSHQYVAASSTTEETTTEVSPTSEATESTEASSTTPAPETTTPAPETTTPTTPKPSPAPKFILVNTTTNKTCILMDADITINVPYEAKDNTTKISAVTIPDNFNVTGSCANGQDKAMLTIEFLQDKLTFDFTDKENQAELTSVTYFVVFDETRFPDVEDPNSNKTLTSQVDQRLSPDKTFFMCRNPFVVEFESMGNLTTENLRVQAYNVNGTEFSGTGEECDQDKTTTPFPITTLPPEPPLNNFTVKGDNKTCISLTARIQFLIPYETSNGNETAFIEVPPPPGASASGNCDLSATSQELDITFFTDWKLTFIFEKLSSSMLGADAESFSYELRNISLTYTQSDQHFPNTTSTGTKTINAVNLDNVFKAQSGGSFKCNSNNTIDLNNGAKMETANLQYKAFNENNNPSFGDSDITECEADTKSNSIVPIAVGATLAALVVIVLIAYLIGRRRSRRAGYESV